jgi:DNA adenine methylase
MDKQSTPGAALKAPFPYFGGKGVAAPEVWARFGDVASYVEPFAGSAATILARPAWHKKLRAETINDADGLIANFWRAVQSEPDAVAKWADNPIFENDLHARHAWLVQRKDSLQAQLEGDPDFFDAKIAGWWLWGICAWIGSGWCSGKGPWRVVDGLLVKTGKSQVGGVWRARPHLNRGQGINRQLPHLGDLDQCAKRRAHLLQTMRELQNRLRDVRICCGDWERVCGPTATFKYGICGVFLDPPYADTAKRDRDLYRVDCDQVAHLVRQWAVANGDNPIAENRPMRLRRRTQNAFLLDRVGLENKRRLRQAATRRHE